MAEAQEYRNFVVGKMSFEISEIMRILQYNTYEEDGGDDPLNDMKKAASLFGSNMGQAMKWVSTPTESAGGLGMVYQVQSIKFHLFTPDSAKSKIEKCSKIAHWGWP